MNIKKFYFQIYHSFGPVYRLIYKEGKWLYEVELELEPIYIERYIRATPSQYQHNEIFPQVNSLPEQVFPSEARIKRFVDYLNRYCKHWKKEYKEDIDDGMCWEINVHINDFIFKSEGICETPKNFEAMCERLLYLTEGKYFG